jgi:hypothetical protein
LAGIDIAFSPSVVCCDGVTLANTKPACKVKTKRRLAFIGISKCLTDAMWLYGRKKTAGRRFDRDYLRSGPQMATATNIAKPEKYPTTALNEV